MTLNGLTRESEIYDFILLFHDEKGYPPTVREIGEGVGMTSPGSVHAYLVRMESDGFIRRVPGSPRAIQLVHRPA